MAAITLLAADRKCGIRHALELAMHGTSTSQTKEPQQDAIGGLDEVLLKVAKMQGTGSLPRLEGAKQWLSSLGEEGKAAAALMGKLSKVRNRQAHPLTGQILALLEVVPPLVSYAPAAKKKLQRHASDTTTVGSETEVPADDSGEDGGDRSGGEEDVNSDSAQRPMSAAVATCRSIGIQASVAKRTSRGTQYLQGELEEHRSIGTQAVVEQNATHPARDAEHTVESCSMKGDDNGHSSGGGCSIAGGSEDGMQKDDQVQPGFEASDRPPDDESDEQSHVTAEERARIAQIAANEAEIALIKAQMERLVAEGAVEPNAKHGRDKRRCRAMA